MSEQEKKTHKKTEGAKPRTTRKKKEAAPAPAAVAAEHKPAAAAEAAAPKPSIVTTPSILPSGKKYYGTGRRKEAVAKVWLVSGTGKIMVNARSMSDYFCRRRLLEFQINRPLAATQNAGRFDIYAFVHGGGVPGQAGAVSLGIARALVEVNPDLKGALKKEGLLTRDPRMKERKKAGLKRARRAFQYTKR